MSRSRKKRGNQKTKRTLAVSSCQHGESQEVNSKGLLTSPIKSSWLVLGGLALSSVLIWSYWPTLVGMVQAWIRYPDYSHGFLVLPVAVGFLWLRRTSFPREKVRPSLGGLFLLLVVGALRVFAGLYYLEPLDGWTFPMMLAASVCLLYGYQCLRWCASSILFLWFMVPIPYTAENLLKVPLQRVATHLSTIGLQMFGQPAISEGNTIWLGNQQLFVEEACSGMRIFVGIFAMAFAYVLFTHWNWWQKMMVLLVAFPVAIVANVIRIVATGLLHQYSSNEIAHAFSHDIAGFVMIPFAALLFWLFLVYLGRLFPEVEDVAPVGYVSG